MSFGSDCTRHIGNKPGRKGRLEPPIDPCWGISPEDDHNNRDTYSNHQPRSKGHSKPGALGRRTLAGLQRCPDKQLQEQARIYQKSVLEGGMKSAHVGNRKGIRASTPLARVEIRRRRASYAAGRILSRSRAANRISWTRLCSCQQPGRILAAKSR